MPVVEFSAPSLQMARDVGDHIRAEYRQIAIMVESTTIGRAGILSVYPLSLAPTTVRKNHIILKE